jgi:hypothetical protein
VDDLTRAFYELRFENDFLTKRGGEFQNWFADLMERACPNDFQRVRPYGNRGDLKCDGYLCSTKTVFQVYAPDATKLRALLEKISKDFEGARGHWKDRMRCWTFVHNDVRGLPAEAVSLLEDLRDRHHLHVYSWGLEELRGVVRKLEQADLVSLFGAAPSARDVDQVSLGKVKVIIDAISRRDAADVTDIRPVSAEKLAANALSISSATLLQAGRQKEKLVEQYFDRCYDPTLGEAIAESFRARYRELRESQTPPDEIFRELHAHAGGGRRGDPGHEVAVLAVLSYFFERCDIFEEPRAKAGAP